MGAFGGFTLTNKGRNLQAKAQAGAVLNYTRAAIGDGTLTGQSMVTLTALISPKKTLPITKLRMVPPDRVAVGTVISNQDISTGFYFREIGIFAQDPDEGEILYSYANSGANAEYLPPAGGSDIIEKSVDMIVLVGPASQVTATIDSSLVFPTFAEMEDAIEEAIANVKIPLVDSNTSNSKTSAPTADALRRTVESTAEALALKQNILRLPDNYLAASVLVNAAPDAQGRAYPDGVSMFKVSGSAGGWPSANGYVLTFRAGSGGYQIFYEMYTGATQTDKTARQWTRSKRDSNAFWQDWARGLTEVDQAALQNSLTALQTKVENPRANLVANGTATFGLVGWSANTAAGWSTGRAGSEAGGEFAYPLSTGGSVLYLESLPFPVFAGGTYHVSAEFYAEGFSTSDFWMELVGLGSSGGVIRSIYCVSTDRWTRRGQDVVIPTGVTSAVIRLVVGQNRPAGYKGFRRIQVTAGAGAQPYNDLNDGVVAKRVGDFLMNERYIELGLNVPGDGAAYIDFHTSATSVDYNARIIADGGSGPVNLSYLAKGHYFYGSIFVDGTDLKKSVSDGKVAVRNAITAKGGTVADADGDGIPTFTELTAGVNTIVPRKYTYVGLGSMFAGDSRTVNIGFVPRIVIISGMSNTGGNRQTSMYWLNPNNTSEAAGSIGTLSLQGHNATNTTLTAFASVNTGNYSSVFVEAWQ